MKISEELLDLFELVSLYGSKDISVVKKYLKKFTDILIYLNEVLAEKKVSLSENLIYSEQLLIKFYLHGLTINKISDCYKLESDFFQNENFSKVEAIDISSLLTIVRAQFETVLVYQYLYINKKDKEENDFRFQCWILESLISRSTIFNPETVTIDSLREEYYEKRAKDLKAIDVIREKIKRSKIFLDLDRNQQSRLLETGKLKILQSVDKMFKESNLGESVLFSNIYYNLSAYAHSEGLVALQLKESHYFINNAHNHDTVHLYLFYSLLMTTIMIKNVSETFVEVLERYKNLSPKDIKQIDFLYQLATKQKTES
jgi:hypothetical protein